MESAFICPQCRKALRNAELKSFPFCSERCRLIDLGHWMDGGYAIPGSEPATPDDYLRSDQSDDPSSPA